MDGDLVGREPSLWQSLREEWTTRPLPGDPALRFWPVKRVWYCAESVWWRCVRNPVDHWYRSRQFRRHAGDVSSPWWSPVVGETVEPCFGGIGVVTSVDFDDRSAMVVCSDGVERYFSWTHCLDPVEVDRRVHLAPS